MEWKSSGVAEVVLPRVYRLGTRFAQETSLHSSPPFPSPFSANLRFPLPVPQPVPLSHPTPQPRSPHSTFPSFLSLSPSPPSLFLPSAPSSLSLLPFNCYSDTDERKREGQTQTLPGRERGRRVETKESRGICVCTNGMKLEEAVHKLLLWAGWMKGVQRTNWDKVDRWQRVVDRLLSPVTFPLCFFQTRMERNKVPFNPVGSKVW